MTEPSVEQLEQAMYLRLYEDRARKVAMIVALVIDEFPSFRDGMKYAGLVDKALSLLSSREDVLSFGDIHNWRYSEMCRTQSGDTPIVK